VSEKVTAPFRMLRAVCDDAETAALAAASEHLHQLDSLRLECSELTAENARLSLENAQLRGPQRDWKAAYEVVVDELAHVREQMAAQLALIEKATTEAAERVVYANVDTSLSDPRAGKLLVVRLEADDANSLALQSQTVTFWRSQCVGWLEAAQDEGDTETKPVDVHHAGMPSPVVRCGDCTATVGHFGDCAKAVAP
jgi:hypothetical protein